MYFFDAIRYLSPAALIVLMSFSLAVSSCADKDDDSIPVVPNDTTDTEDSTFQRNIDYCGMLMGDESTTLGHVVVGASTYLLCTTPKHNIDPRFRDNVLRVVKIDDKCNISFSKDLVFNISGAKSAFVNTTYSDELFSGYITATSTGDILIVGKEQVINGSFAPSLIRLDAMGTMIWKKNIGPAFAMANSSIPTGIACGNDGIIVVPLPALNKGNQNYLSLFDLNGDLISHKPIEERILGITLLDNNSFGCWHRPHRSNQSENPSAICVYNINLDRIWNTYVYGDYYIDDLVALPDGSIAYIAHLPWISRPMPNTTAALGLLDASGQSLWQTRLYPEIPRENYVGVRAVTISPSGHIIACGHIAPADDLESYTIHVSRYATNGSLQSEFLLSDPSYGSEFVTSASFNVNNELVISGNSNTRTSYLDILLAKIGSNEW